VAGALGLAVLASLPLVVELLGPDPSPRSSRPSPTGPTGTLAPTTPDDSDLQGRLVYVGVDPNDSGVPRLVVLELATGAYEIGAAVRDVDAFARLVAAGSARDRLVLIRRVPGRETYVADLLLDVGAVPRELARGGRLEPSPDGRELLVTRVVVDPSSRCPGAPGLVPSGVVVERVGIASDRSRSVLREPPACDGVRGATWYGSDAFLLNVGRATTDRVDLVRGGVRDRLFEGVVADVSHGIYAFLLRRRDLLIWPGGGGLRPIVTGARTIGRAVAASVNGRFVVVAGSIDGEPGLSIVDVASGVVVLSPDALPSPSRIFGEAVADDGTVFLVGYDGVAVADGEGVRPLPLPLGAPDPVVGPVAWMP
jgi:hypothetical protein